MMSAKDLFIRFREKCLTGVPFLAAAMWCFWEPDYYKVKLGTADRICDAGAVLFLFLIFVFFLSERHEGMYRFFGALLLMAAIMTAATVFRSGAGEELRKCLKYIWPIAGTVMLTELSLKRGAQNPLTAFYAVFWIQTAVNTFTIFFYEHGLYLSEDREAQFFLGQKNLFIMTILPGLCLGLLLLIRSGRRMTADYALFLVFSVVSVVRVWSASSLIGLFVFALTAFFLLKMVPGAPIGLRPFIGIWALLFTAIVVFKMQYLLEPVVVHILHKDMSFSGRIGLWDRLLKEIARSPLIGYGVETTGNFRVHAEAYTNLHFVHSHNYILELLMKGGFLLLAAFVWLLLETAKKLDKGLHTKEAKVLLSALFAFFICFVGDCYEMRTPFYMLLAIAAMIDRLAPEGT